MRLIDADALYEKVDESQAHNNHQGIAHLVHNAEHAHFKFMIHQAPTIEAEPVRHGRWETWGYVFHGIEWERCSCCGKCADVSYYGLLDGEIKMSTPAICGGCGARMDATDTNVGGKGGAEE